MFSTKENSIINKAAALIRSAVCNITIEPCFFLFAMNYGFYIVVSKTLYINKVSSMEITTHLQLRFNLGNLNPMCPG